MKDPGNRRFVRALKDESGQAIWWFVLTMTLFLGMGGLVVDVAHAYFSYRLLQASTNAAALAGAEGLPTSAWLTQANAFSSTSGNNNAYSNLPGVTMITGFPVSPCLTTLKNQGMACTSASIGNSVQVAQQAAVPTYFLSVLGIHTINIKYEATASMRGAAPIPYNVAIIVDSTNSMGTSDADCNGSSRLTCALAGVATLLGELYPCGSQYSTCTVNASGQATGAVDQVAIFTFPNVEASAAADEYNCNGSGLSASKGTIMPYSFPAVPSSSNTTYTAPTASSATYQVTGFLSNYRASTSASSLSGSSSLASAVGSGTGGTGCEMSDPGGAGTYYAGVIYQAQTALQNMAANNSGTQNVMIILSDGQAQSTNFASTAAGGATISTTSGIYPSTVDQCQQAVVAANYATGQGTRVYTVAYGSEDSGCTSSGGGTDNKVVLPTTCAVGANCTAYPGVSLSTITPCWTMEQMASAPQYFFSDYNQSGSGSTCQSASQPETNINQIFKNIFYDLTTPRLIPNTTT